MFSFVSYLVAVFVFLGKFRRKWLWIPTIILGIYLFWVFLTWNKVPTVEDKIEIIPLRQADSTCIAVTVKHPYFTFNNFSNDFLGFWSDYGNSVGGVRFSIYRDSIKHSDTCPNVSCNVTKSFTTIRKLLPNHNLDTIGSIYEFRVRKELFGNMDSRNANNEIRRAWDDKGFSLVKRIAKYSDNVCLDSITAFGGINKYTPADKIEVGYNVKLYYTLLRLLRLEDISQFNYNLVVKDDASRINRLEVDFGGPAEIKGIWPTPDIVEPTRIVYLSNDKIAKINEANSVKMFCQSLETTNVQNVRMFILTTLISLCFAYTLREFGVFIMYCFKWIKRKYEREQNEIEQGFKRLNGKISTFWKKFCSNTLNIKRFLFTFKCRQKSRKNNKE